MTEMKKLDLELDKLFGPRPYPKTAATEKHPREIAEAQITQAIEIGLAECRPPVERGQVGPKEGVKIWEALAVALRQGRGYYAIGQGPAPKIYLEIGELANVVSEVIAKSRGAQEPGR